MRRLLLALGMLAIAVPAFAQEQQKMSGMNHDPDNKVAGGGVMPAGWAMRLDRANANAADVKFVPMGATAWHATMGPAAIFFTPAVNASGTFKAEAKFTQTKAPTHPEAYGLIVGGKNLDQPNQEYLYFIVRGDGKYMIKHRAGSEVHTVKEWTDSPDVVKADASGKATNALKVDVEKDKVEFYANGKKIDEIGKQFDTNGLVGLRVNHNLDVHIEDFVVNGKPVKGK